MSNRPLRACLLAVAALATLKWQVSVARTESRIVQFIFTSDAHYGISRPAFRGHTEVDSHIVNAAMIDSMNDLPAAMFPADGGVHAGERIGRIDFVVEAGDVANREEITEHGRAQPAARSWRQFTGDYMDRLRLTDAGGHRAPVYVVPGNHDLSNAVGFYKPMVPPRDPSVMAAMYKMMMPAFRGAAGSKHAYEPDRDPVLVSHDIGGVHFEFVQLWLDSRARTWLDEDLSHVDETTPVVVFTHDEPDVEAKHFHNPNGLHDINATDRFENLLVDEFADGTTIEEPTMLERAELEHFMRRHQNIGAYFHGNSNWNEFYEWTGPLHTAALHTFRVDSPIKGHASTMDERRLSFQVATIDVATGTLTVRECLWNTAAGVPIAWGASKTVSLSAAPLPAPETRRPVS